MKEKLYVLKITSTDPVRSPFEEMGTVPFTQEMKDSMEEYIKRASGCGVHVEFVELPNTEVQEGIIYKTKI